MSAGITPEPRVINVRGVQTVYRRAGAGQPLLYLHGSGLTRRWLPLHAELANCFDVIAADHPGYGDTLRPRWYRTLDDIAVHYADLMDAFDLESAHVVGHSMGGRIGASFAALYPERVRSLHLVAPAPLATVSPTEEMAPPSTAGLGADARDPLLFNDMQHLYPEYQRAGDRGDSIDADADPFASPEEWDSQGAASLYRRLQRITCPRQILIPDDDRVVAPGRFDDWAQYLDAPLVRIAGAPVATGHLLVVQEPRRIRDEIHRLAG